MSALGVKSATGIAFDDPADPEATERGDEHHEHLSQGDGMVQLQQDGDCRYREAEELAKPTDHCHRVVLRLEWKGAGQFSNRGAGIENPCRS